MLFNFLKKNQEYIQVKPIDDRRKSKVLIVLIIAAIFILAFGGAAKKQNTESQIPRENYDELATESYIAENEKRLEEILSAVQGAGKVKTMITVDNRGEKVLAMDKKSENKDENDKEKSAKSIKQEQTAIVYGTGNEEQPFVLKEKLPLPSGVLVVATGAGDESVRLEIYEAVRALYGISGHRIKVTKGSIK